MMKKSVIILFFELIMLGLFAQTSRKSGITTKEHSNPLENYYLIDNQNFTAQLLDSLQINFSKKEKPLPFYILFDVSQQTISLLQNRLPLAKFEKSSGQAHLEWKIPIDRFNPTNHNIYISQQQFPNSTGKNVSVLLKEYLFDSLDLDLLGKMNLLPNHAQKVNLHATTMATLIAGKGISYYTGKGIVPDSKLYSTGLEILLPEENQILASKNIFACNHSYGSDIDPQYNFEAMLYDLQAYELPQIQHIFSAGNDGQSVVSSGIYQGLAACNLSGAYKHSKNSLSIGSIDTSGNAYNYSSQGPAFDGRIKPELVSYGEDGTSGAAAVASGMYSMCQDHFIFLNNIPAPAHLLKGILINSAKDIGTKGPDYKSGYGKMDLYQALNIIQNEWYSVDEIKPKEIKQIQWIAPKAAIKAFISLSWTDPPAVLSERKSLVNDLDLFVKINQEQKVIYPWVLNPNPNAIDQPALTGIDTLNPLEKIELAINDSDTIHIFVYNKSEHSQKFSVNYYADIGRTFELLNPTKTGFILPKSTEKIQWFWFDKSEDKATIEYKYVDESNWNKIVSQYPLNLQTIDWLSPEKFGLLQFRFILKDTTYYSEKFRVCAPLKTRSILICNDFLNLNYEPIAEAKSYKLEVLRNGVPVNIDESQSSSFNLNNLYKDSFLRVIPIFTTFEGASSYFIKPSNVSSSCYIQLFEARHSVQGSSDLFIELKEIDDIHKIEITKVDPQNQFKKIVQNFNPENKFKVNDVADQIGSHKYRLDVFSEQKLLESSEISIFLVPNSTSYYLNTNTFKENGMLVFSPNENEKELVIFDLLGRKLYSRQFTNIVEELDLPELPYTNLIFSIFENDQVKFKELVVNVN